MLDSAAARLEAKRGRWSLVEADLADPRWRDALPKGPYDAVVSSFCIHHLPHERKRELYGEVLDLLEPGGLFLNWEHVAAGQLARGVFDEAMVDGLRELQPDRPPDDVEREYAERPDAAENKLLDSAIQCAWLRSLGYEAVDVYFKWVELAVFGGVKGGDRDGAGA
jgi:tRNA (cmo5U34)-methyltransferase